MYQFRVTKYDPYKRDEHGTYLDEAEWTCPSEVAIDTYLDTEQRYIRAVKRFFDDAGLTHLRVVNLHTEYSDYLVDFKLDQPNLYEESFSRLSLREDQVVSWDVIEDILKISFRYSHVCSLALENRFFVNVGWDFYMYLGTGLVGDSVISQTHEDGLFVEVYDSPYQMRNLDETPAVLEVFSHKTQDIVDDQCVALDAVSVSDLRRIFGFSDEHSVIGYFEVSEAAAQEICKIIPVDFEFDDYSYYVDTTEEFL